MPVAFLLGCTAPQAAPSTLTPSPQVTLTPVAASTRCPQATPEALRVEPVQSPTQALQQVIQVRIGLGEQVTIETESGVFTATGNFNAFSSPALVTITLAPDTTHKLKVSAKVREVTQGGCNYGGYVLRTERDRNGLPLVIEQRSNATIPLNLPTTVVSATLTATLATSATPTSTATTTILASSTPTATQAPAPAQTPTTSKSAATATPVPPTRSPANPTSAPRPTAAPAANCTKVSYADLIASPARPAALANLPERACVMVVYKDGEETRHTWYPVGAKLRLGYVMYVRLPTNQVTIFTKDGVHMAREFMRGRKAEDLPLKREGGRVLLNASGTAIFGDLGGGDHQALVDVLVRQ
ncbi:MAG: hypothetical protein KIH69_010590 [Anaerolineae bacterium]|nr:hypothetical protein [Anaerolineae bacterium]